FNRIERLRDPPHVSSLSLPALKDLFARVGLPEPRVTLYQLVEVRDLLARAFPNPGDEIEIVKTFRASAADGRLGIPVHIDGDNILVTYRAAILTACQTVQRTIGNNAGLRPQVLAHVNQGYGYAATRVLEPIDDLIPTRRIERL